jgi:hypothetical protein
MIIDQMREADRIEYMENLLNLERITLESVTEQRDRLATEVTEARAETTRTREFMDHGFKVAKEEITELREQRDMLEEVIKAATVLIAAKGRHNTMLAYQGLREALAAVKGGSDE